MALGKRLILSGILVEAADAVLAAYPGMRLVESRDQEGWRVLVLDRA
jgi:ribosomal protein L11 methylase PrmA